MGKMMRNEVLKYLVETYFNGDAVVAAGKTGYTQPQIDGWLYGGVTPNKDTIEYFIHRIFTPEFRVIVEFAVFDSSSPVKPQLREMLGSNGENPGIYAFYDSTGALLYIGKASNLLEESYSSILRDVTLNFPSQVKNVPSKRFEIVRYISAYDVGNSNWIDYPKHVESLILRISKPRLNKKIGGLELAYEREAGS